MEPDDAQDHYTEKLVRMPNLALYLDEEDEAPPSATRQDFGLPEGRVLYGCLQSLFKYLPRHDGLLPQIAREVPEALFVFLEGTPDYMTQMMKARLEKAFAAHGLEAAQHVIFLPRQTAVDFNRLMQVMDVCDRQRGLERRQHEPQEHLLRRPARHAPRRLHARQAHERDVPHDRC